MKLHQTGAVLMLAVLLAGCTNRYQYQVDQSLLLQENQRLEEALFVTHAQLVDLKRENESLQASSARSAGPAASSSSAPAISPRRIGAAPKDDYDEAPPYEPPQIKIPENAPESTTLPDALRSSVMPKPRIRNKPPQTVAAPPEEVLPELVLPNTDVSEQTLPAWSPTR